MYGNNIVNFQESTTILSLYKSLETYLMHHLELFIKMDLALNLWWLLCHKTKPILSFKI